MSGQYWGLEDFRDAAAGAAVLGSGGGGSYQDALYILNQFSGWTGSVPVLPYDGQSACSVIAMMGSPDAAGAMSLDELAHSIGNTLSVQARVCGFSPVCAIPIEIGPINSLVPLLAAALQLNGITWVVDGDGAGRAVPELPQTTYAGAAGLPASPCVVADNASDPAQVQSGVLHAADAAKIETIGGALVKSFGAFAGISMWPSGPMNGFALSGQYIPGTLEQIRLLGSFLRERPSDLELAEWIRAVTGRETGLVASNLYVTGVTQATSAASLDAGVIELSATPEPSPAGACVRICNLNENLIAWSTTSPAPLVVAPDSICYYSADEGAGFSNATDDLSVYYDFSAGRSTGKRVSVIRVATLPQLSASPGVMQSFASLLRSLGYGGALPC
ncbi:DUF917 family protein [Uliginosibacterium paludis]|uniref:DUF917 family protein n=1 Tax=Uliginosibacterium paludis TaxID=1615952 RepID=A0ABV2CMN5_9RHOO